MEQIVYKRESIEMVLRLLNQLEIKGADNARLLAVAFEKLKNEGEMKEDTTDGSQNSL